MRGRPSGEGAVLDAMGHEVAIASLTLVYETLEVR